MKALYQVLIALFVLAAFYGYGEYKEGKVRYEQEVYANRSKAQQLSGLDSLIHETARIRVQKQSYLDAARAEFERVNRWQFGRSAQERYSQIQMTSQRVGEMEMDLRSVAQREESLLHQRDNMLKSYNYYDNMINAVEAVRAVEQ